MTETAIHCDICGNRETLDRVALRDKDNGSYTICVNCILSLMSPNESYARTRSYSCRLCYGSYSWDDGRFMDGPDVLFDVFVCYDCYEEAFYLCSRATKQAKILNRPHMIAKPARRPLSTK